MIAHPLQLTSVYAFAVGNGLARSFSAEGVHADTAAEWIHYCVKAAEEAFAAVMDDPPPARRSAAMDVLDELEDAMERADIGFAPPRKSEPATGAALTAAAHHAAAVAFRCCLPQLTNRRRVQAYIACIAVGVANSFLTAKDGNSLLYPAQLALAAYPKRRANTTRKATNL